MKNIRSGQTYLRSFSADNKKLSIKERRKLFFDKIGRKLRVEHPHDWYKVTVAQVEQKGGRGLLIKHYSRSLYKALNDIYPEHKWQAWKFADAVPSGYWKDLHNQRELFDSIAEQLNIKHLDDWYKVRVVDVFRHGGRSIVANVYENSLFTALQHIYPEHTWYPWLNKCTPTGYWHSISNQKAFMDWIAEQMGIKSPTEWCCVTSADIVKRGGSTLLQMYSSLLMLLNAVYPEVPWSELWKETAASREQNALAFVLQKVFQQFDVRIIRNE